MTPHEKAKELIFKYTEIVVEVIDGDMYENSVINGNMDFYSAKQSAVICVDEILKLDYLDSVFLSFSDTTLKEYYQQVKEEIQKY